MLLGQAFRMHFKSRDWKPPHLIAKRRQEPFVRSILSWFADFPSATDNLYSIHNMVATGLAKYDKLPGEWYGPGTVCYVLRDLVELHERQYIQSRRESDAEDDNRSHERRMFRVHVAPQSTVYRDAIEQLMTRDNRAKVKETNGSNEHVACPAPAHPLDAAWEDELVESGDMSVDWDCPLLLLIPLRLGLNSINEEYVRAVAHTFSLPQSVGGLGGRPRSARWFYGALSDGSKIFGLDPHTVQNAPRKRSAQVNGKSSYVVDLSEEYLRSVHTTYPEVFSLQKMDPSIALGFYCRTRQDLEHVFNSVRDWHAENRDSPELFSILDAAPNYSADVSSAMDEMMMSRLAGSLMDGDVSDEDDYVML
jgi:cysteine protease ATG4